jgi:hypothetical protein
VTALAPQALGVIGAAVALIAAVCTGAPGARAQGPGATAAADARERAFVEELRREDPGEADRYVALRDARNEAITEVQKAQARYSAAVPELRAVFLQQVREAQRAYADRSLALLDFLDARARRTAARYQAEIDRINHLLEERAHTRAELEKLKRGE